MLLHKYPISHLLTTNIFLTIQHMSEIFGFFTNTIDISDDEYLTINDATITNRMLIQYGALKTKFTYELISNEDL